MSRSPQHPPEFAFVVDARQAMRTTPVGDRHPVSIGGRYRLQSTLGRGGSAVVYAAQDTWLGRQVAVKVLHPHLGHADDLVAAFQQEARAAAGLNHPGIVAVHDVGGLVVGDGTSGAPWIVLELVDGVTLTELLSEHRPMPPQQALELIAQVLDALAHAHARGVVHRDVSPANIMVTSLGRVKVMDFGIAAATDVAPRATTPDLSRALPATVRGTAHYIAPEQAMGRDVDARADVYAVGCVLFALLTGRPPFAEGGPAQIARHHVRTPPPVPSAVRSGLPAAVDELAARALAKEPAARYPDATAMGAAVRSAIARLGAAQPGAAQPGAAQPGAAQPGAARLGAAAETTVLAPVTAQTSLLPRVVEGPAARVPVPAVPAPRALRATGPVGSAGPAGPVGPVGPAGPVRRQPAARQQRRPWARAAAVLVLVTAVVAGLAWFAQAGPVEAPAPVAASVRVPDVAGRTVPEATTLLAGAGLGVAGQTSEAHDSVPAGLVIGTDPAVSATVERGSEVALVVSAGPAPVGVPALDGLTLAAARDLLAQAGLVLGDLTRRDSSRPGDTVLDSEPPSSSQVPAGASVSLVLASGSQVVPEVRGRALGDARAALEAAGFAVVEERRVAAGWPEGTVVETQPEAGVALLVGSRVTVVVVDPPPTPTTTPTTTTTVSPTGPPGTDPGPSPTATGSPSATSRTLSSPSRTLLGTGSP